MARILTVSRKMARILTVSRKMTRILTVSRKMARILTVGRKSHHSIENLQYSKCGKTKTQRHFQ